MTYRYIVSDLDGTLLNDEGVLSPYTLETLRRVQAEGMDVILASGRLASSMLPFARAIGVRLPILAGNGAVTADPQTGAPLAADCVPAEDAVEAARMLEDGAHYFHCYDVNPVDRFYCAEPGPGSALYGRTTGMEPQAVGRLSRYLAQPGVSSPKLLAIVETDVLPALRHRLQTRFAGRLTVTGSSQNLIEITRHGINKGAALRALCKRLDASPTQCIAFGDGGNDEAMLAAAGLGVAVRNAQPSLLAVASRVCGSNTEDGVAHYLAQHVLGKR